MSRSLWFVAGAGAGVWAVQRVRRTAEALTAAGVRDRLHALDAGLRLVRDEVATGRAEKEAELRERLGLLPPATPALPASRPTGALPTPASTPSTPPRSTDPKGSP